MITLKKWSTFFQEWFQIIEKKYPTKKVSHEHNWGLRRMRVKDGVMFDFEDEKDGFVRIGILFCSKEEFQNLASELMNHIKNHDMDLFVSIRGSENVTYKTGEGFEDWIPSGEKSLAISNIMEGIEYNKRSKIEFGLLDGCETLLDSPITLRFNLDRKSVMLMMKGRTYETPFCYEECFSAEEIQLFVEDCKKEKEQMEQIEKRVEEEFQEMFPGEEVDIRFGCSRELKNRYYELGFYVDDKHERIYMQNIDEEYILSLIIRAAKIKMGIKMIEKELKKDLYEKDSYAYEHCEYIHLFEGDKIKLSASFKEDPEIFNLCIQHSDYIAYVKSEEKTKEITGTKDEVIEEAKQLFVTLYNGKRMKRLFSAINNRSHLEKIKVQLKNKYAPILFDKDTADKKMEIENEIQKYFEESTKENGIPKIDHNRWVQEISLETVKFLFGRDGTIEVSKI